VAGHVGVTQIHGAGGPAAALSSGSGDARGPEVPAVAATLGGESRRRR
jgi:hypothetical protein